MDIVLSCVLELVRVIITIIYFGIFYEILSIKTNILTGFVSFSITTSCLFLFNNAYVNLIATILGIFIISLGFNNNIKKNLLLSVLCYAIMFTIDIIAYYIIVDDKNYNESVVIGSFVSVLSFYLVVILLKFIFRNKLKSEFSGQWYILLIVSVMSVALLCFIYREINLTEIAIIIISTTILVLNFLLYIFYSSMLDRYTYEQENSKLKQQMNMYEHQIRMNVANDAKLRAIRHDMKHHIREIRELTHNKDVKGIEEYINSLSEDIESGECLYNTGNAAIDGILNYYIGRFRENDIHTDIDISIPENMNIKTYDINIILGNLLDNALENAIKVSNANVNMKIQYIACALHILIKNSYDGKIYNNGDIIMSRKKGNHGYGIDNVRRIVNKYGGDVVIIHDEKEFSVGIIMYI